MGKKRILVMLTRSIKIHMRKKLLAVMICMGMLFTGCASDAGEDLGTLSDGSIPEVSENVGEVQTEVSEINAAGVDEPGMEVREEDDGTYYTMEDIKALEIPEDMLAYWMVLHNKMPFISYDEGGQEFYWDEYLWNRGEPDNTLHTDQDIVVVDMNNDGGNEIVLTYGPLGMVELFHYEDGAVYGYQFVMKGMCDIQKDGIYSQLAGASQWSYCRLAELGKDGYTEEVIAEVIIHYDYGSISGREINGKSVSQEEFEEFMQDMKETGEAERIWCEENLLDNCLLEGLTEEELYMVKHVATVPMTLDEEYPIDPVIRQIYYDVLTNEKEFISVTDGNQSFYLDEYYQKYGSDWYQVLYFSFVDMDRDGIYEIVLSASPGITQILHYEDGNIYSYQYEYDDMGAMTNEGIFLMDSTYTEQGFVDKYGRIVSFTEDGCVMEEVDYKGDINDDRIRYYNFSEEMIERYLGY